MSNDEFQMTNGAVDIKQAVDDLDSTRVWGASRTGRRSTGFNPFQPISTHFLKKL
jgi:hypothetical protein